MFISIANLETSPNIKNQRDSYFGLDLAIQVNKVNKRFIRLVTQHL
jgi:hypothetical protein